MIQTPVGVLDIQRGLGRATRSVLKAMPVDPHLLVKQGEDRDRHLNRQLAWSLAFVAGAVNAGGFLAVIKQAMADLDQDAKNAGVILLNEIGVDPGIDRLQIREGEPVEQKRGQLVTQ